MQLEKYVVEIEKQIENHDLINESVSEKSIGWHLDHILRVNNGVSEVLKDSTPSEYRYTFNLVRSYIFARNSIPRGSGRAPKTVVAIEIVLKEELLSRVHDTKKHMSEIGELPAKSNFKHPYFGVLNLKQTLRFMRIHTEHHLKIVRDILK